MIVGECKMAPIKYQDIIIDEQDKSWATLTKVPPIFG